MSEKKSDWEFKPAKPKKNLGQIGKRNGKLKSPLQSDEDEEEVENLTRKQLLFTKNKSEKKTEKKGDQEKSKKKEKKITKKQKILNMEAIKNRRIKEVGRTKGDGNCGLRAVLQTLNVDQEEHLKLRQAVVQYLQLNPGLLDLENANREITNSNYIQLISRDRMWIGGTELQAISRMLGVNIRIYQYNPQDGTEVVFDLQSLDVINEDLDILEIDYDGSHYQARSVSVGGENNQTYDQNVFTQLIQRNSTRVDVPAMRDGYQFSQERQDEMDQIVQDEFFLEQFRSMGNIERIIDLLENSKLEDKDTYIAEKNSQPQKYQVIQEDFVFEKKNTYNYNHCQDGQSYVKIQKVDTMQFVHDYLLNGTYPESCTDPSLKSKKRCKKKKEFQNKASNYRLQECGIENCKNQVLVKINHEFNGEQKDLRIIKQEERKFFLDYSHSNHEHPRHMTLKLNKFGVYWYGQHKDCEETKGNCVPCVSTTQKKGKKPVYFVRPIAPNYRMVMDCVEISHSIAKFFFKDVNKNSKYQILTCVDQMSKFANVWFIENKKAVTIAKKFENHLSQTGAPTQLLTDNGLEFINQVMIDLCLKYNIEYIHGRPYHPQTQGVVEAFNKTFQAMLRTKVAQYELDFDPNDGEELQLLDFETTIYQLVYIYNHQRQHSSIGRTPIEAHRLDPSNENDQQTINQIIDHMEKKFPKHRNAIEYQVDDKVLVINTLQKTRGNAKYLVKKNLAARKRDKNQMRFSLKAVIVKKGIFNVDLKFTENDQGYDTDEIFTVSVDCIKLITEELFQKMINEKKINSEEFDGIADLEKKDDAIEKSELIKVLNDCMICYSNDSEDMQYTSCCENPIHYVCNKKWEETNVMASCPACRTNAYIIKKECLVEERQYRYEKKSDLEEKKQDQQGFESDDYDQSINLDDGGIQEDVVRIPVHASAPILEDNDEDYDYDYDHDVQSQNEGNNDHDDEDFI